MKHSISTVLLATSMAENQREKGAKGAVPQREHTFKPTRREGKKGRYWEKLLKIFSTQSLSERRDI